MEKLRKEFKIILVKLRKYDKNIIYGIVNLINRIKNKI